MTTVVLRVSILTEGNSSCLKNSEFGLKNANFLMICTQTYLIIIIAPNICGVRTLEKCPKRFAIFRMSHVDCLDNQNKALVF